MTIRSSERSQPLHIWAKRKTNSVLPGKNDLHTLQREKMTLRYHKDYTSENSFCRNQQKFARSCSVPSIKCKKTFSETKAGSHEVKKTLRNSLISEEMPEIRNGSRKFGMKKQSWKSALRGQGQNPLEQKHTLDIKATRESFWRLGKRSWNMELRYRYRKKI